MASIKCPKCGEVFKVDEREYANILEQVSTQEFEDRVKREVENSKKILETKHAQEVNALRSNADKIALEKDAKIVALKASVKSEAENVAHEKDKLLAEMKQASTEQIAKKDAEIASLKAGVEAKVAEVSSCKDLEIADLKAKIDKEVSEVSNSKDMEILKLQSKVEKLEHDIALNEERKAAEIKELKDTNSIMLKMKEDEIDRVKEYKSRLSTKMVDEGLEQYCLNEFNKLRATAFREAYFEKDNDSSEGTKGDFIYRDYVNGVEFISIMFEMKTEVDSTKHKHRNEDFFDKLDKDRKKKNCEYAVLVSTLEEDSEYYNAGIVDVSHRHKKMFVVRPQCFISIITLLRNAAVANIENKQKLVELQEQNIDVTNFENVMLDFQYRFQKNYDSASTNFEKAIEGIDATIKKLEKIKDSLLTTTNQLRLANDKAQDLSIKKLTRKNPTMKALFDEVREKSANVDNE